MIYTYSIAALPNHKVNLDGLNQEIKKNGTASLKAQYETLDTAGDHLNVTTNGALAPADKTSLDAIVGATLGTGIAIGPSRQLKANFTTTSTALSDTPLSFLVEPGDAWEVEIDLSDTCGAGGMVFSVTVPGGSTLMGWLFSYDGVTGLIQEPLTPGGVTPAMHFGSTGTAKPDHLAFSVVVGGTAGACTLQVASGVGGQSTTLLAGSKIRANATALA